MWRWVDPDLCLLPQHLLAHGLASHFGEKTGRSCRVDFHPPSRTATPRRRLDPCSAFSPATTEPPSSPRPALPPGPVPSRPQGCHPPRPARPARRPSTVARLPERLWGRGDPHCIAMCTERLTQTKERCVNPKEKPREEPPTARSGAATGSDPPARAAQRSGGKGTAHPTAVVHGVRHKGSPSNLF